jgi:ubiquinol-cytochrome c reductase iron-sulfur subunit
MTAVAFDRSPPSGPVADVGRRDFLIKSTGTLALGGIAATAVPFLASWAPTSATRLTGQPAVIDLSKIERGAGLKLLWRGTPMWGVKRTSTISESLPQVTGLLKDPDSLESIQPAYAQNAMRARRADILVITAVCTHLSCLPEFRSMPDTDLGPGLDSGFFCACHGSRYDSAGRVLKGSPAPTNLPVPSYYFTNESTLVIGADSA